MPTKIKVVLFRIIKHLNELDHIWVIKFLENGNFTVYSFQWVGRYSALAISRREWSTYATVTLLLTFVGNIEHEQMTWT